MAKRSAKELIENIINEGVISSKVSSMGADTFFKLKNLLKQHGYSQTGNDRYGTIWTRGLGSGGEVAMHERSIGSNDTVLDAIEMTVAGRTVVNVRLNNVIFSIPDDDGGFMMRDVQQYTDFLRTSYSVLQSALSKYSASL